MYNSTTRPPSRPRCSHLLGPVHQRHPHARQRIGTNLRPGDQRGSDKSNRTTKPDSDTTKAFDPEKALNMSKAFVFLGSDGDCQIQGSAFAQNFCEGPIGLSLSCRVNQTFSANTWRCFTHTNKAYAVFHASSCIDKSSKGSVKQAWNWRACPWIQSRPSTWACRLYFAWYSTLPQTFVKHTGISKVTQQLLGT